MVLLLVEEERGIGKSILKVFLGGVNTNITNRRESWKDNKGERVNYREGTYVVG